MQDAYLPVAQWIMQQIPILEIGGSTPFGQAKKIKLTEGGEMARLRLLPAADARSNKRLAAVKICRRSKPMQILGTAMRYPLRLKIHSLRAEKTPFQDNS